MAPQRVFSLPFSLDCVWQQVLRGCLKGLLLCFPLYWCTWCTRTHTHAPKRAGVVLENEEIGKRS